MVGADVTDIAVDAVGVVEGVDPVGHRNDQLERRCPSPGVEKFNLHSSPERFDDRVIKAVTDRTRMRVSVPTGVDSHPSSRR